MRATLLLALPLCAHAAGIFSVPWFSAAFFRTSGVPSGSYVGTQSSLGQTVDAKLVFAGATVDVLVDGAATVDCEGVGYAYVDGTVDLADSDCVDRALSTHGATLGTVAYDAARDVVVVSIDAYGLALRVELDKPGDADAAYAALEATRLADVAYAASTRTVDDDHRYHGQGEEDAVFVVDGTPEPTDELARFLLWTVRFHKTYPTNGDFATALQHWRDTVALVDAHNSVDSGFAMEANAFADLAPEPRNKAMYPTHTVRGARRPEQVWTTFHHWVVERQKSYASGAEVEGRFAQFQHNHRWITVHNKLEASYRVAHNAFSDLSAEERTALLARPLPEREVEPDYAGSDWLEHVDSVPDSVDWEHALPPVRDQGACGSCWAFATTGALSGAYYVKTNTVVDFSVEELTQCDDGSSGCNGGLMSQADDWIRTNGLQAASTYPYTSGDGKTGTCDQDKVKNPLLKTLAGHTDLKPRRLDLLAAALSKQPVAIALEADQPGFHFYSSGVYDGNECGTSLDHGVVLVGMGEDVDTGTPFWRVQNSWGDWGEGGYIRLQRDPDAKSGSGPCGMALSASIPVL